MQSETHSAYYVQMSETLTCLLRPFLPWPALYCVFASLSPTYMGSFESQRGGKTSHIAQVCLLWSYVYLVLGVEPGTLDVLGF